MRTTSMLGFEEQRKRFVLVRPVSQFPSPLMGKYCGFRQKRLEFWHSLRWLKVDESLVDQAH